MLHRGEYCPESVKNLGCEWYLTVQGSSGDSYVQSIHPVSLTGGRFHVEEIIRKSGRGSVGPKPDVPYNVHRLGDVCNGINCTIKKADSKALERRNGDPRKTLFQVKANTSEPKQAEARKCGAGHITQQSPLNIRAGLIMDKRDLEDL